MSQQAHSSPQHFCSLAQHTRHHNWARDRQLVPHPPATPVQSPLSSQHTHPAPSFCHPAEKQRREESSRWGGREKDMVGNQCYVQALYMYIYKKWNEKFKGEDHKSLVTAWHSGKLWWATGESRFPQHLCSQLRRRLKWKTEANGCIYTKAEGSWAVQHPGGVGFMGRESLRLESAPQGWYLSTMPWSFQVSAHKTSSLLRLLRSSQYSHVKEHRK